jgi:Fe/S biogenesis protein NfuA
MVKFSEIARSKILELMSNDGRAGLALRFAVAGRGPGGFQYRLGFVEPSDRQSNDVTVDAGGFQVFVDAESAPNLAGASVDYIEGTAESGFKIENPNPLWKDPQAGAVQTVIDQEINPAVAQHGGWVTLLEVKDDVVYIQLGGGCQGCGMVDVTLKQGIEVRIREVIPSIRSVVDTTDHAGGTNPYYRPSKGGGHSPFGS